MMRWRSELGDSDPEAIREIVAATGFFSSEEVEIAAELVTEALERGEAAGNRFVIVECGGRVAGYACLGPIPLTASSYDPYWIAVQQQHQGLGLGRRLIEAAEQAARAAEPHRDSRGLSHLPVNATARLYWAYFRQVPIYTPINAPGMVR